MSRLYLDNNSFPYEDEDLMESETYEIHYIDEGPDDDEPEMSVLNCAISDAVKRSMIEA